MNVAHKTAYHVSVRNTL